MPSYNRIFNKRGQLYNEAGKLCALARRRERDLLIDALDLKKKMKICDAPAGGGYLADGIAERTGGKCEIACVDPAANFINGINGNYKAIVASLEQIPLPSESMDRVGSLAGLHHLKNKAFFFKESFRILKRGGKFAVADVLEGSKPGSFLNDAVDRLTTTGHKGIFLEKGELTYLLKASGFHDIHENYEQYYWTFPDLNTMKKYCHQLFGLVKATLSETETELRKYFNFEINSTSVRLPWSLSYAVGTKM